MKAILKTGCGCSRMIDIPEDAPEKIYVALNGMKTVNRFGADGIFMNAPNYPTRTFIYSNDVDAFYQGIGKIRLYIEY